MMLIDLTGEVVPCPYFHLSDTSQSLGNTNTESLEEIWNGEAFRDLRARHVTGDLSGTACGRCVLVRMMGQMPFFEWGDTFREEAGHCHTIQIPERFWARHEAHTEEIIVLEDGIPLPGPGAMHADIRSRGGGLYSVWHGFIYLSATDNSNPACNGRIYRVRSGQDEVRLPGLDLDAASGRNLLTSFADYKAGRSVMNAAPSKITFIETSDCNIDCPSCSQNEVRLHGVRHRPETSLQVMRLIPLLQQLIWHGGEPYMIPAFRSFVDTFERKQNPNLSFGFMSNGTMLSEPERKKLAKFDQINVTISIDSFNPDSFAIMRAGARYDRVMENMLALAKSQDHPKRKLTVAQIIGKTNIADLPDNLIFARDNNLRLMVNPITQYPPTEKLTLISGLEETEGWEEALDRAEAVIEEARRSGSRFLHGLDPSGAVREIRDILNRHRQNFASVVELIVQVEDRHGSLGLMRRPGLVVEKAGQGSFGMVSYLPVPREGEVRLRIPATAFAEPLVYGIYPDLNEVGSAHYPDDSRIEPPETGGFVRRRMAIPSYRAPPRPRNLHYAKHPRDPLELERRELMISAYEALSRAENTAGYGFTEDRQDGSVSMRDAIEDWRRFVPDFVRPFFDGLATRFTDRITGSR